MVTRPPGHRRRDPGDALRPAKFPARIPGRVAARQVVEGREAVDAATRSGEAAGPGGGSQVRRRPHAVCPILPFPATSPRSPDRLIEEYGDLFEPSLGGRCTRPDLRPREEPGRPVPDHPADRRRPRSSVFAGTGGSQVILSPVGSKALALGMLMAALDEEFCGCAGRVPRVQRPPPPSLT